MQSLGKHIRLARWFKTEKGRTFVLALDHPIAHGAEEGIFDVRRVLDELVPQKPDAVILHKGIAVQCFKEFAGEVGLILKLSSFAPYHPGVDVWVSSVDEAVELGADAVSMGIHVGTSDQAVLLRNLGLVSERCARYGMPLIVHAYPSPNIPRSDVKTYVGALCYGVRVSAELGADMVKTSYTGSAETFRTVVESSPVPVGIAGGPKTGKEQDVFEMVAGALSAGAVGVVMGRSIWGRSNAAKMVKTIRMMVHEGISVSEAVQLVTK